jgi:hypothetical protein
VTSPASAVGALLVRRRALPVCTCPAPTSVSVWPSTARVGPSVARGSPNVREEAVAGAPGPMVTV